jgi:hypothetical protein
MPATLGPFRCGSLLATGLAVPLHRWHMTRGANMNWDLRHRKSSFAIRLLLAAWIATIVIALCATGRWWGLVFVVPLVLDLNLLRRIVMAGSSR